MCYLQYLQITYAKFRLLKQISSSLVHKLSFFVFSLPSLCGFFNPAFFCPNSSTLLWADQNLNVSFFLSVVRRIFFFWQIAFVQKTTSKFRPEPRRQNIIVLVTKEKLNKDIFFLCFPYVTNNCCHPSSKIVFSLHILCIIFKSYYYFQSLLEEVMQHSSR